jgi:hypothetical protein
MVGMTLGMRRFNLPQCRTLFGKMTNMTIVVAGAGNYVHLLWRWGCHSFRHDVLMWRWTASQLMMMLRWVVTWGTHHPVFGRSTTIWGYQSLLLLAFQVSTDCVICDDGIKSHQR